MSKNAKFNGKGFITTKILAFTADHIGMKVIYQVNLANIRVHRGCVLNSKFYNLTNRTELQCRKFTKLTRPLYPVFIL